MVNKLYEKKLVKKLWSKKNGQRIEKCWSRIKLVRENFGQKTFCPKKILVKKNLVQKNLDPKTILFKKFWSEIFVQELYGKKFGQKDIVQNFG